LNQNFPQTENDLPWKCPQCRDQQRGEKIEAIQMEKVRIELIALAFCGFLITCKNSESRRKKWVGCVMGIDSVYVLKRSTRGAFSLNDTLSMWVGFELIENNRDEKILIDPLSLDLKGYPLWSKFGVGARRNL
jgi:hypothetical protein